MATTVTPAATASFQLGPFDTLTLSSGGARGTIVLTSQAPKLCADQTLSPQSGTYGPWGAPMSVVMTITQGACDYTVNVKSLTVGQAQVLSPGAAIALPKVASRLLVIGDSRNARSSVPFTSLGGWVKTVTAISAGNADGSASVTFSAAHNIPVGQRLLFDPDASIDKAFRNRWFDFTSTGSTTGTISVPSDAYDRANLIARIAAVSTPFSGSSQCATIDAVQGIAGCLTEFLATLGQPWTEVVNLCVPGFYTAETLALVSSLDLTQFSHAYDVDGINDMANGVDPAVSLANKIAKLDLLAAAGVTSIVHDEHPQGTMDATKQTWLRTYNTGLRAYAASKGSCILVPVYGIVNDPATDTGSSADLSDGTHWTAAGAEKMGRAAAAVAAPFIKASPQLVLPVSTSNYITNGNMAGTSGTHTTAVSGLANVQITGTAGQFSCNAAALAVNLPVTISGTFGGTGSITGYSDPTTYYIVATNGSTTFTLSTTPGGSGVVTTAGTPTGLTYTTGAGQSQGQVATSWVIATPGTNVVATARKVSGVPKLWRPNTAYSLGDVAVPTYETGLQYLCTTAGTSSSSAAPTWGTVPWATTADGSTLRWTAIRPLPNLSSRADWQMLQGNVYGTVAAQERVTLQQTVTLATVGLAAGDWVRFQMRVHAYDSAWRNVMLTLRTGSTIDSLFSFAADGAKNSFVLPSVQPFTNREGILRTPWWRIPAGQTTLTAYLEGGLGTGSENSTIRLFMTEARLEKRSY